jgi:hypothetical protein
LEVGLGVCEGLPEDEGSPFRVVVCVRGQFAGTVGSCLLVLNKLVICGLKANILPKCLENHSHFRTVLVMR